MKELTMELYLYSGETKDSTVDFESVDSAILEIKSFLEGFYNEGYSECDPRYHDLTPEIINRLLSEEYVRVNSTLSLWLNEVEN